MADPFASLNPMGQGQPNPFAGQQQQGQPNPFAGQGQQAPAASPFGAPPQGNGASMMAMKQQQ